MMLQMYSQNVAVAADSAIPLNNVSLIKGTTAEPSGTSSIVFNRCGVYMVSFDASASASTTVQLYKNGVAQPEAQSTDISPSFTTLVQVPSNNSCCPCSSGTTIQFISDTEVTFTNANVVITKII